MRKPWIISKVVPSNIVNKISETKSELAKSLADKTAADKAIADKAVAYKIAEDKVADEKAKEREKYLAQFNWHDSNFGVMIDSAKTSYGIFTSKGRIISLIHKDYAYVQINLGIYSKNGSKVGSAIANIDNLSAGTTWQFEAVGSTSNNGNSTYKVESVVGW